MCYFLYARKSEEDDSRQVQSIEDQLRLAHELAAASGITITRVYQEARSAKRPGRPIFSQMIAAIERGEARGILAWHPDRLARNAVDAGILIDLIDRGVLHDLKFHSYRFENTPEGKWMLGIVLGQSKYFVDKLSKDVRRGLRSKLDKGHYPQLAPPGYLNDPVTHTVIADPQRFDLMRRAFDLMLSGTYSAPHVLEVLNTQWGYRTPRRTKSGGGPLSRTSFYHALSNIFYTGLMEYRGEILPGQHPVMLSQNEFDRVQTILGRGKVNVRQKREFRFSGLLRCGLCSGAVTAENKVKHYPQTGRSASYTYYHCVGKRGCSKVSISEEAIEAQVVELLSRVTLHESAKTWGLPPVAQWHRAESLSHHGAIETLTASLHGLERRKSNLLAARLDDPTLFSDEEFREQKALLQEQINTLRREIAAAHEELERVERTVENVFNFAFHAKERFENGDTRVRREIAAALGLKYVLTLGKLDIEPHPLLLPILGFEPPKSGSGSKKDDSEEVVCSAWLTLRDNIRNLAHENKLYFGKLNQALGSEFETV